MVWDESDATSERAGPDAEEPAAPERSSGRTGWLPIETNLFDRIFIAVVAFVAVLLLWMRFVEGLLPLWMATVVAGGLGVLIVSKG
jgi:predicted small integral membrane protein